MKSCGSSRGPVVRQGDVISVHVIRVAGVGGFLPAAKQIANVAALPGIVGVCAKTTNCMHACADCGASRRPLACLTCILATALRSVSVHVHVIKIKFSRYSGNMAAFDMDDPESIVSPGAQLLHYACMSSHCLYRGRGL